ncbi:chitin deacetylase, partial [Mortierella alpina]
MLPKVSLIAVILCLAGAIAAATPPSASPSAAPSSIQPPLLPLPPFNGTFSITFPDPSKIAPTDTPEVKKWIAELNLTAVPTFPVVSVNSNGDIQNPNSIPADACDWSVTNCFNKDLVTCPLGVWGLTYDDGPTSASPKLYDFLDQTNQKATLFYIGGNVVQNWQSARRACGAGHQIGTHSWSHQMSTSLTNEQFIAEVKYTELAIKEVCGFTPTYFRPPYGDIDNRIRGLLWAMGYTSVIWDYDTNDWDTCPPDGKTPVSVVDASFTKWIADAPNDKTGHITLEHELCDSSVDLAIAHLPQLQATWKTMPVSACMNNSHPYKEQSITLATMDGAKTGVDSGGNSTTGTTTASASSATPSGSSNMTGKTGSGAASTYGLTEDVRAVAMVA